MMKIDKQTAAFLLSALTVVGGWVDNKQAMNRLETSVQAIEKRVERIESRLDTSVYAQNSEDSDAR